jgi:hypothetical protein
LWSRGQKGRFQPVAAGFGTSPQEDDGPLGSGRFVRDYVRCHDAPRFGRQCRCCRNANAATGPLNLWITLWVRHLDSVDFFVKAFPFVLLLNI